MTRHVTHAILLAVALMSTVGCWQRDIQVTDQPVSIISESMGIGTPVQKGDLVTIDYKAMLLDGKVVQEHDGYRFEVGKGQVILAFDESLPGMRKGGIRRIESPPHKHWGRQGYGNIPPGSRLIFEIHLIAVNE
ncbi:MAG: FKBP-type peptidyl-prolyl cis-trans isomerase [Phycisphaerales bacterium]